MACQTRRRFLKQFTAGLTVVAFTPSVLGESFMNSGFQSKPWIELSRAAYLHNAQQVSKMANGKPVIAVLKNNAYGLGAVEVGQILDSAPSIVGMAVVKDEIAIQMRQNGVSKPILLMGDFDVNLSKDLLRNDVTLSAYSGASLTKIEGISDKGDSPVKVALYVDTGLGRMGIPLDQVMGIANKINRNPALKITQCFSTLTTPKDFALEQIKLFDVLVQELNDQQIDTGLTHLAPSYSLLDLPSSHRDAVRPGILLHGSFPLAKMSEGETYPLQIPYRLKAPIIRLEKLKPGDTIGFSRFYPIEKEEWIATLPIGWADGYYSGAENGAKVLLGDRLYSVVNVNASHTNVSLGAKTDLSIGDVATLIGPEKSEISPEGFAMLTGGHNYLQINYKESIPKKVYESF